MREDRRTLVEDVGHAVLAHQRATDAVDDAVAARFGVNRTDLRHIDLLRDGRLTAGQLAERSGLSPAATTALIDRLVKKGYLRRVRDEHDRRRVFVEITETARAAIRQTYGPLARESRELLERYTDEQLALVRDFLRADQDLSERHHHRISAGTPDNGPNDNEPNDDESHDNGPNDDESGDNKPDGNEPDGIPDRAPHRTPNGIPNGIPTNPRDRNKIRTPARTPAGER
jgi:DNA-binding MarR family transcriptional regulator